MLFFSVRFFDDLIKSVECAAADEEYICCVDLYKLLMGMFTPALRRNVRYRAFEQFQSAC